MKAIQAIAFGDARVVLRVVDLEPPGPPGAGEVLISMEYAPLNRHDLGAIRGVLPVGPPPFVPGNEGTGVVSAVGPGVTTVRAGDRVTLPLLSGSWREQLLLPAAGLSALPDADPEQLAMIGSNPPSAVLMLDEYTDVPRGSYVAQNAANSGVGRSLIAIAHARGLKTINFARNQATFEELTAAGADIVLPDTPESATSAREMIGDAPVPLAVDGVGGASTLNLASVLSDRGVLVAYAAVSGSPLEVPSRVLTGQHATVRGFFLGDWDFVTKTAPAIREAAALIAAGRLVVPVAGVYGLDKIDEALGHLARGGKILLDLRSGPGRR